METKENKITTFEEHLQKCYGPVGTKERTDFEIKAKAFTIGEIIKEERRLSRMAQEQWAELSSPEKKFTVCITERR
jgi:hypothetical protein